MTKTEEGSKKKLSQKSVTIIISAASLAIGALLSGLIVFQLQQAQISEILAQSEAEIEKTDEQISAMRAATELRESRLDSREAELNALELSLSAREVAVVGAEIQKSENEFQGGMHTVGQTVSAGTYTANVTSGMCYYSWKSGTGSDADIIDNNIVKSGLATVTLSDGEFFESNGCGTWVRQ